jgi:hypothetical protein
MSRNQKKFFIRLCCTAPLWLAILPGIVGATFGAVCGVGGCEQLSRCVTANVFGGAAFWLIVSLIYIVSRLEDAMRGWLGMRIISWGQEIMLLLIGGYLVWVINVLLLFLFLAERT